MHKLKLCFFISGSILMGKACLSAHSHHDHTYIVEQSAPIVVVQQTPQPTIVVQQGPAAAVMTPMDSPPADLVEQIPASPGENYIWQKGHWQWNGSWVWVGGQWSLKPNGYTVYVPGYWRHSHHHHHWEWVAPYWK